MPRDHWLTSGKGAIIDFQRPVPLEGYRRLTFMMLDATSRRLQPGQRLPRPQGAPDCWPATPKPSHKGTGFVQPLEPHEHWHVDVSYLNIAGTFYFLCSILDGCSRFIVHWEIREAMTETDCHQHPLGRSEQRRPQSRTAQIPRPFRSGP